MEKQSLQELCPKKKGRYINPHLEDPLKKPLNAFLWKMGWYDEPKEKRCAPAPANFTYPLPDKLVDTKEPSVIWINHSTFLVSYKGIHILTDPIWSSRCSPVHFAGPQRKHMPGVPFKTLPPIDYVLISHNHYDHLDRATVKRLYEANPEIQWIVPKGVKNWFLRRGIKKVIEFAWWEEHRFGKEIPLRITAVPAQHFSGRAIWDFNRTLWAGYVIEFERAKNWYFAGDTGYNPIQFKEIGAKWGKMDLSLIPIGCYVPRKFMSPVHIDPLSAVKIHQDVGSNLSVGMHWKTFSLGDEPLSQPPYDLYLAMRSAELDPKTFCAIEPGHALNW